MMRPSNLFSTMMTILMMAVAGAGTMQAQALEAAQSTRTMTPRLEISLGYNHIQANAPPGGCQCFGLNGGYASVEAHVKQWLSVEGEFTGQHANDISLLGQDLTLETYMGGLKYSFEGHRFVPFVDALAGRAHGYDSYFPTATSYTTSASSLAFAAGGGVDYNLGRRFAVRGFARYLQTQLPNGADNEQNHLVAGGGIVVKFGGMSDEVKVKSAPPPPEDQLAFSCSSSVSSIEQGDTLEVLGSTLTEPARLEVSFTWTTTVGKIVGAGRRVLLDTTGVPPGEYHVIGRATAVGRRLMTADCDVPFRIKTPAEAVRQPTPAPADAPQVDPNRDREFHENVKDALFDFDSAAIRPDAQQAINHAAAYLQAHPNIYVMIGGYADDRGSAEYNLALGEKRAEAARDALIAAGVAADRLQIISYGKEVQVCTAENEACRQQNRRAAFSMHP